LNEHVAVIAAGDSVGEALVDAVGAITRSKAVQTVGTRGRRLAAGERTIALLTANIALSAVDFVIVTIRQEVRDQASSQGVKDRAHRAVLQVRETCGIARTGQKRKFGAQAAAKLLAGAIRFACIQLRLAS